MKARLLVACALIGCAQGAEAPAQAAVSTPRASVATPSTVAPRSEATVGAAPADAMRSLRRSLSHSTQHLSIERRAGRLHIDPAGTFQTATVITFDKDGRPNKRCLDNASELDHMMGETQ